MSTPKYYSRGVDVDSKNNKPWYAFASSCVNIFALLSILGIALVTAIGLILTSIEIWFYPGTNSPQDTGTSNANITHTPVPLPLLAVEPDDGTPTLSVYTRATLTPRPTWTLRPTSTKTVTCVYKIKSGDTLYSIAKKFGIDDYSAIRCSSSGCRLFDPTMLEVGWLVTVPGVAANTCLLRGGGYPD